MQPAQAIKAHTRLIKHQSVWSNAIQSEFRRHFRALGKIYLEIHFWSKQEGIFKEPKSDFYWNRIAVKLHVAAPFWSDQRNFSQPAKLPWRPTNALERSKNFFYMRAISAAPNAFEFPCAHSASFARVWQRGGMGKVNWGMELIGLVCRRRRRKAMKCCSPWLFGNFGNSFGGHFLCLLFVIKNILQNFYCSW